ncbi:MAG: hypothetical protein KDE32_05780 [Novosphingobium sp.]|nr:hypothetical protein [Novosphingobium sp.]
MASLELVDHTQDLKGWHLPQQQHGVRQPPEKERPEEGASRKKRMRNLTAE